MGLIGSLDVSEKDLLSMSGKAYVKARHVPQDTPTAHFPYRIEPRRRMGNIGLSPLILNLDINIGTLGGPQRGHVYIGQAIFSVPAANIQPS